MLGNPKYIEKNNPPKLKIITIIGTCVPEIGMEYKTIFPMKSANGLKALSICWSIPTTCVAVVAALVCNVSDCPEQ
jgi:hypothetical protein